MPTLPLFFKNQKMSNISLVATPHFIMLQPYHFAEAGFHGNFTNFTKSICCISQAVEITSKLIRLYDSLSLHEHPKVLKTVKNCLGVLIDDINSTVEVAQV